MANNKIIYAGEVLIDLTGDTVDAAKVLKGSTFHGKDGVKSTGTCTYDSDTSDATVTADEVLSGKIFYARGSKLTGSMANKGGVTGIISAVSETYNIPQGYHDGSGKVSISSTEQAKIIAENIREGVSILGVTGSMTGSEDENPQENITVAPSNKDQTITPDTGYTCLRQVTVSAISYKEEANAAGGTTITIAG